ncbi:MAG: hypothetical protein KC502_08410 [Myxococcales bacterium]|nr:hypothetical protein [Myxococcales bacterium]
MSGVDRKNLTVTGRHAALADPNFSVNEEAVIVVSQAFGPRGDNLVGISDATFDGYPAVTVGVRIGDREGLVHLSPIHGDTRKSGFVDIEPGTRCQLFCPVSGELLGKIGDVEDGSGAAYYALYLTDKLSAGEVVQISDVWGHYHSRIIDDMELISYWAAQHS